MQFYNRQQRREESRRVRRHRLHPKAFRQFDGEQGVYGEVICVKCQCHVAYLDKAEWRQVEAYNRNRSNELLREQALQRATEYGGNNETQILTKTES